MKVKLPLGMLLALAVVLGYLLGTEAGRRQRDSLVRRLRHEEDIDEVTETVDDPVADAAATDVASNEG